MKSGENENKKKSKGGFIWRGLAAPLLIVVLAAVLRMVFLTELGRGIPYLTFYPAVMVAAVYGGLYAGLLSTALSVFLCYYWIQQGYLSPVEWLAFSVFLISCIMMSGIAEALKRAQRRSKEAQEQAEVANKAKSTFLSNMSHELRTPLNALLGFSSILQKDSNITEDQQGTLDIITRSGEHLLNLINNILDISKIESGRVLLEEKETNLHHLIIDVKSLMYVKVAEKNLSFSIEQSPDFPKTVLVDADKLRRVLINLIGNAIKFTKTGGIVLRASVARLEASPKIRIRFEVEDSGTGISEHDKEQIFNAFVQLENQHSIEAGTGLGLVISKQNVTQMGGEIGVTSEPGKGSIFYFEIPASVIESDISPVVHQQNQPLRIAGEQPAIHILIAEDQPENRLLLFKILEPLGFILHEAENGKEAVELCEQWHPDLIFMDIRMPVMDGLEATQRIKATAFGSQTKIVALTAHALEDERQVMLDGGCDDFIRKPYNDSEIYNTLVKHLGVNFIYDDEKPSVTKTKLKLKPDDLKTIPFKLRQELLMVTELLDEKGCAGVIKKITAINREVGDPLLNMVKNLQFQELLTILENIEPKDLS